jgi:glycosyltransferase involved in cell wall biosynthesis
MKNKKNILIVTPSLPFPLNSGGNVAQFTFNDEIRKDYNIHLIFPMYNEETNYLFELKSKWDNVYFYPFYENFNIKLKRLILNKLPFYILKKITYLLLKTQKISKNDYSIFKSADLIKNGKNYFDKNFIYQIKKIIEDQKIDLIQIEFFDLIELGKLISNDIPKIFVHHEIRYIRNQRLIKLMEKPYPIIQNFLVKNEKFESLILKSFNKIITLSDIDKQELLKKNPLLDIDFSPAPINYSTNFENENDFKFSNTIVFLGGEQHFPNKDAVDWFLKNCWNQVKINNPNIVLKIIGTWKDDTKKIYSEDSSIKFRGFVEDLKIELKNSIFIVPIRIGSGIRMKIVEAINIGCPIISSSIGIEGLDFKNRIDFLVADNSKEFIDNINELIKSDELSKSLINNSKKLLSTKYSFSKLIQKRKEIYEELF